MSARLTIEIMQKLALSKGGHCISNEYINTYTKLDWQCEKGHIWKASPNHVRLSNSWCPKCAGTKKLSIEEMQIMAQEKEGYCLSDQYVNAYTKLEWECKEGHRWWMRPGNVRNSNQWCPRCSGKEKGTIEKMKEIALSRGGKCLSLEYRNKDTKLEWECAGGHIWSARSGDIKRGHWCPECPRGFGERICRSYFESIFRKRFPSIKPKWLRNSRGNLIELDGFCEELNLAFEYQGHQHYLQNHWHKNKEDFELRKQDDESKMMKAKRRFAKKEELVSSKSLTQLSMMTFMNSL